MLPTLRSGERVTLHSARPDAIRPQDVIAFRSGGKLILHRVHAVFPDRVITAGDNYDLFDPPVPMTAVIGVARDVPGRPAPRRWPRQPGPAAADVWLIGGPASPEDEEGSTTLPAGWRLHWRRPKGIGVSAEVLAELQAAAAGKPCVGVTEHAVYTAAEVLGGLPPQTQVLVGCSFGGLKQATPGNLVPTEIADVFVRVGPPRVPVSAAEALRELAALVAPGEGAR
jgi:hypothetical protein